MPLVLEQGGDALAGVGDVQIDAVHEQLRPARGAGNGPVGLRHHRPRGRHDAAGAEQRRGGVRPSLVGLHPPLAVGERECRVQQVPGVGPLHLVGRGGEHQAGTAQGKGAGHLGKVAVEADHQPDTAERRILESREPVAGAEHRRLEGRRVQVRLAVPCDEVAFGVEDEGSVIEATVLAQLGHAPGGQPHVVSPRRIGQLLRAWTLAQLGVVTRVLRQRLGVVPAGPQLGQHQQFHPSGGGVLHHGECHRHVVARLAGRGQPLCYANQEVSLHVHTMVPRNIGECMTHLTEQLSLSVSCR